jgi:hypothetical protein
MTPTEKFVLGNPHCLTERGNATLAGYEVEEIATNAKLVVEPLATLRAIKAHSK